MSEDKIDPSHWSASTGEREDLAKRIKNLDLDRKRGSGATGNSDDSTSSAVIEEATPAIATSAKNLSQLSSSGKAAQLRRTAQMSVAVQEEEAEREEKRREESVAPKDQFKKQLESSGRAAQLRRGAYIDAAVKGEDSERTERRLEEERAAPMATGPVVEKVKEKDHTDTERS